MTLADFIKIVEILDANGASFGSMTQFNTTTSMGRAWHDQRNVLGVACADPGSELYQYWLNPGRPNPAWQPCPHSRNRIGDNAVLEYRPTETLPLLSAMSLDLARLCRPRRAPKPVHPQEAPAPRRRKANSRERQVRT